MLKQGERIGDWIVVDVLGEGGMGAVYRCRNAMSERIEAAVKVVKPHSLENEMERFLREVESLDALRHRAVVHVKGWGQDKDRGLLWLAMDLVTGEDLEKRLAKGAMQVDEARRVFSVVADALRHAHGNGIFHRDIKPANIILAADGSPRIVDFGIAVQKGRTRLTAMGTIPGTPAYMAPEIFGGEARPDPVKLDVYALGQVLFEAVTGRHAYPEQTETSLSTGQSLVALMGRKLKADALDPGPEFPDDIRAVVRASTQPEPVDRLTDMAAFVELLTGVHVAATGQTAPNRTDTSFAPAAAASKGAPATEWVSSKPPEAAPKVARSDPKGVTAPPKTPAAGSSAAAPPPPPPASGSARTGSTGGMKIAVAGVAGAGAIVAALVAVGLVVVIVAAVALVYVRGTGAGPSDTGDTGGGVEAVAARDVQVAVTGLPSGTPVDVSLSELSPDSTDGMSWTFAGVPTGERTVRVSAGTGCVVAEEGACPGCCSCVDTPVTVEEGSGTQTVLVHVPGPPDPSPRTVRVVAPLVADGWSTFVDLGGAKGPKGKRVDSRTKDYADVVPGAYEARVEAGKCPATAAGCWPDGDCPDGCQSWKGVVNVPCGAGTFTHSIDLPTPAGKPPAAPTVSASACRKSCPSGAFGGGTLYEGTRVKLTGIHEEDAYCGYSDLVGLTGTISGEMYSTDGCWMGGAMIADDGTYYYFYKASLKVLEGGGTPAPAPVTSSAFGDNRYVTSTLPAGTSVQIVDVHPDDAYYGYVATLTGMRCSVAADLSQQDVGWYGGSVYCPDVGDMYFYKVALAP